MGESHCAGAGLSRLEQTVAIQVFVDRLENLAFADRKNGFQHDVNLTLRAFKNLHITFEAGG